MDLERLIREHVRNHPGFAVEDLAKLLYQGVMGMGHLLEDRARFLEALRREWHGLAPLPSLGEALLEPIHPTDPVVRLNLRPAQAAGLRLDALGPLLADQPRRNGSWAQFKTLWEATVTLAREGRIPFPPDELVDRAKVIEASGHAPGHSPRYRELNRPAYRLIHDVTRPEVQRLLSAEEREDS
ncbi:TPA: hypothetical protein DCY65_05765 [Candidatus Acetothermia bacterium]|nr:hypothetical protein [Candidatus Acetothermia bacterium]